MDASWQPSEGRIVKDIAGRRLTPSRAVAPVRQRPSALTALAVNGIAITLVAAASYGVNVAGRMAEARGWPFAAAVQLEIGLALGGAAVAGIVWGMSKRLRVPASWLCLSLVVRAGWSAWLLYKAVYAGL
jgi:hypothetical protein